MAAVTAAGRRQVPSAVRPASAPAARVRAARVQACRSTQQAQDTHHEGCRGVVPPGRQGGGFRWVVPRGRQGGGFRGVVPQGQHREGLRRVTARSGVVGREGRSAGQARPVG